MKRHSSLVKLGLVFALFAGLAFKCGNVSDNHASSELSGYWYYAQAESEGSTSSASGHLMLNADGTFEDNRYLGGVHGYRTGTFKVSGDTLTLKDEGSGSQNFSFYVGAAKDSEDQKITTLTLKGTGISYLLTKKT